jgi:hypothetical protein
MALPCEGSALPTWASAITLASPTSVPAPDVLLLTFSSSYFQRRFLVQSPKYVVLALVAGLAASGTAGAMNFSSVVATASGFEASYTFDLPFTLNGNDVTSIMILEAGAGGEVSMGFPFSVAPGGTSTLAHSLGFFPTSALIVGLERPDPNVGDGKTHIVMLVDRGFAAGAIGLRFSEAFPNSRHSLFIANFLLAVDGDAAAQQELEDFFLTGDGAAAAFTPGGSFRHIISTVIVPEPTGLGLWASGLGALVLLRRRA